jgi:hypothetical protein
MNDDRRIGRKAIIQFLNPIIGCTTWNTVRYQARKYGLPLEHNRSGTPFVVPADVRNWDERGRGKNAPQN